VFVFSVVSGAGVVSRVGLTCDRYGHLMPGNESEAAALLDAYLARANTKARLAQLDGPAG
jgi:hypothetical protein